jgi:predicted nucleotidyltransferase/predicted RNase H-like HicB family nuclease
MIETLLPRVRRSVLALLFSRPDGSFYLREIVRATGGGKGAVERELRSLVKAGILVREKRGNLVYFRANSECPIYPELRALMVKTAGLADVLREALAGVEGIALAFVFGSVANGSFDARSDVDVLIVGDASFADISDALTAAERRLNREVTPTVYPPEEFREKVAGGHHFLTRVLSEPKIMLVGSENDIERLGRAAAGPGPDLGSASAALAALYRSAAAEYTSDMKTLSGWIALPMTFLLKQEDDQWAALAPEVAVASCGKTSTEARRALKDAVETYVSCMVAEGRPDAIWRHMPQEQVDDFKAEPAGRTLEERQVLLVPPEAADMLWANEDFLNARTGARLSTR